MKNVPNTGVTIIGIPFVRIRSAPEKGPKRFVSAPMTIETKKTKARVASVLRQKKHHQAQNPRLRGISLSV